MIKNYFKIAFRGFRKHKLFTFINIVGLSIGITAALVIYLIVQFDFTFDNFHKDSDRVYRVVTDYSFSGEKGYNNGVTMALPGAAKTEATGLDIVAPYYLMGSVRANVPNGSKTPAKIKDVQLIFADQNFFKIFDFKWLAGSAATSLKDPGQVVLTTKQAKIYFPKLDYSEMIGRGIIYDDSIKATVSGIIVPFSKNSDFAFHDIVSYISGTTQSYLKPNFNWSNWTNTSSSSQLFVKLSSGTTPGAVERQFNAMLRKHHPRTAAEKNSTQDFKLQPLAAIHFDQIYGGMDGMRTASKTTLYGLLGIAAFLLILGCINFINLTTAQASQRAKEIGIRKTMGGSRAELIMQFLSETFLITLLAVIIAVALCPLVLKLFSDFIPPGVTETYHFQPALLIFLLLLIVVVSLLSGFYPAIVLSSYQPVQVLKGQSANSTGKTRGAWLRKSLTVTQFVIAQFFIMATLLVSKQIYYATHKNLGFKQDAIVFVSTPWKAKPEAKKVFLEKIKAIPQIALISVGSSPPSSNNTMSTSVIYSNGKQEISTDIQQKYADANYLKLYQIKLLAGRNITEADTASGFLVNETYAKIIGFKKAGDAVGTVVKYNGNDKNMRIIGVVADFHQKSLHAPIKPLLITHYTTYNNGTFHLALTPQTQGGNEWKTAINGIEKAWKQVYPDDDFEYKFFDESIAKFYTAEQNTGKLLNWATGLSIFISCLGLLGLAIYTTTQRTKEIGVRKVLGASVTQIVTLLSTELIWLILLAFVLVTPIAWFAMHKWMEGFADRTNISWWIFALSGAAMLGAALLTLSFQTVKAAVANPVKSLRSE
ncbi:ABC transporter permease [Mucilaginibacter glaciei]|uniref:ABC transporter permease n=1 Tax=Mucilaginibacter glaciei TaxID=2772109 RepID=A0A926NJB4_9SPHI|nr:ABC transporter permease [Mucilaginibacter glaciei]MBD1392271.1 ABC transporter permease [Mucilaginibacter glaciei]